MGVEEMNGRKGEWEKMRITFVGSVLQLVKNKQL
jgi:hypothetical protein